MIWGFQTSKVWQLSKQARFGKYSHRPVQISCPNAQKWKQCSWCKVYLCVTGSKCFTEFHGVWYSCKYTIRTLFYVIFGFKQKEEKKEKIEFLDNSFNFIFECIMPTYVDKSFPSYHFEFEYIFFNFVFLIPQIAKN